MKKLSFLFVALIVSFSLFSNAFAAINPTECKAAHLVVDGKSVNMKDKPILVGKTLYMPVKALAVGIGIKDDKNSIIINNSKKTYTLVQGKNKLILKLDNKKATYNGKAINLDNQPILYKKTVYLPANSIAKIFGRNAFWNSQTSTITICKQSTLKLVTDTINKINKNMGLIKYKSISTTDMSLGNLVKQKVQVTSEIDILNKVNHVITKTDANGYDEEYKTPKYNYSKSGVNGIWLMTGSQEQDTGVLSVEGDDINIYSGLTVTNNQKTNEILLEGDVEFEALFNDVNTDNTYKAHTKIIVDKTSYYVKELIWNTYGVTTLSNTKLNYINKTIIKFSDFNGKFEVKLPDEFKGLKETKVYENTDLGVKLNYPSSWEVNENISGANAAFISPQENDSDNCRENMTLLLQDISEQPMTLEKFTSASLTELEQYFTDYKLESSQKVKFGGLDSTKVIYTYKQGQFNMKNMQIWTIKNDIAYILSYTSTEESFNKYIDLVDTTVQSFVIE